MKGKGEDMTEIKCRLVVVGPGSFDIRWTCPDCGKKNCYIFWGEGPYNCAGCKTKILCIVELPAKRVEDTNG